MKCNIRKGYESLTPYQKEQLKKFESETISKLTMEQVNHEEAELQKIWIGYACIILHEAFGFGKKRCLSFIGNWKRLYRENVKLEKKCDQEEFLRKRLSFFGEDYPTKWIDSLENIGK